MSDKEFKSSGDPVHHRRRRESKKSSRHRSSKRDKASSSDEGSVTTTTNNNSVSLPIHKRHHDRGGVLDVRADVSPPASVDDSPPGTDHVARSESTPDFLVASGEDDRHHSPVTSSSSSSFSFPSLPEQPRQIAPDSSPASMYTTEMMTDEQQQLEEPPYVLEHYHDRRLSSEPLSSRATSNGVKIPTRAPRSRIARISYDGFPLVGPASPTALSLSYSTGALPGFIKRTLSADVASEGGGRVGDGEVANEDDEMRRSIDSIVERHYKIHVRLFAELGYDIVGGLRRSSLGPDDPAVLPDGNGVYDPVNRGIVRHKQESAVVEDPVVSLDMIRGLTRTKIELDHMIRAPMDHATRGLYTRLLPPSRVLYVNSDEGSGVRTAVTSVCASAGVNLVHLTVSLDIMWDDLAFDWVLDYAILHQPCVVLFDRCDVWFIGTGYQIRGERFILSRNSRRELCNGSANVFFVFSCSTNDFSVFGDAFQILVGYHRVIEGPMRSDERRKCYVDWFQRFLFQLKRNAMTSNPDQVLSHDQTVIFGAKRANLDNLFVWCDARHEGFNAAMIFQYCERVSDLARRRVMLNHSGEFGPIVDPIESIPVEADFDMADQLLVAAVPGRLTWSW